MSRRALFVPLVLALCGVSSASAQTPAAEASDTTVPEILSPGSAAQDLTASDPQDPFVRGLVRLDERLRLQREAERLAREAYAREQGIDLQTLDATTGEMVSIGLPPSDPDFFTAFAARNYRLDGLVLSRPERDPVIHIFKEYVKPRYGILYWSGVERRWVYERKGERPLGEIAARFNMLLPDLLAINGVARVNQLDDPDRIYVSPRDNGPLIHIVQRGDTLAKLAQTYRTGVGGLQVRNGLDDKGTLQVGQRLLIREKTLDADMTRAAVAAPGPDDEDREARARRYYARLAQYKKKPQALRGAREFFEKYFDFMDSDIALRQERDADNSGRLFYNMDVGPLRSKRHAEAYCALYRRDEMPCLVVARVPGPERTENFDSQAIISVSPFVFYEGDQEKDTGRTNLEALTKLEYFLTEGQELGDAEGTIAKITDSEIYLTDARGYLLTLPLRRVPELDPIDKKKREAAARQAALNEAAAVAGAAAGGAAAPDVSFEELGVAEQREEGEAKRRAGSVDAFNKVLGTEVE